MMNILVSANHSMNLVWVTNTLDGLEDFLIFDRIFSSWSIDARISGRNDGEPRPLYTKGSHKRFDTT